MKKFAVFDIDGTLFRWQLFHDVVFELIEAGYVSKEASERVVHKMREWRSRTHKHSFREYELALVDAYIPCIRGLPLEAIATASKKILQKRNSEVYSYTRNLTRHLKQKGYKLIAISGSQDEIVKQFAKHWDFDIAIGQIHVSKDGAYTGGVPGNKLVIEQKGVLLTQLVNEHDLSWEESYAIGDSASDAQMLELVTYPIAFNPNDQLYEIARKNSWKIVIERKNMIYELEPKDGTYLLAHAGTE